MKTRSGTTGGFEWAIAERALHDAPESGDAAWVVNTARGVLIAVIDGLGHGPAAAAASALAMASIEADSSGPVLDILTRCHRAIHRSRGAVISLASIEEDTLSWVGVGNVEGLLVRRPPALRERLLLWGGVVGHVLPTLRSSSLPLAEGDLLVFATDGLRSDFSDAIAPGTPPSVAVVNGFIKSFSGRDDALILAISASP
ncbi:MAG: SpoIIE family protein phosphatase [Pseudomonadota bacterium]|nr:SpoIIE family protein phosphatase [Pseudomonadota bacterium]